MIVPGSAYKEYYAVGLVSTYVIVCYRKDVEQVYVVSSDNPVEVISESARRVWEASCLPDSSPNRVRFVGMADPHVIYQALRQNQSRLRSLYDPELRGRVVYASMGSLGTKAYAYAGKTTYYNNQDGMWLDLATGRLGYKPIKSLIFHESNNDMVAARTTLRVLQLINDGLVFARLNVSASSQGVPGA